MFRLTQSPKGSAQPLATLLLTGALLLGAGTTIAQTALAEPLSRTALQELKQSRGDRPTHGSPQEGMRVRPEYYQAHQRLPRHIARKVRQALAAHLNVARRDVQVIGHRYQTWSDSCLGLGSPVELCAATTVEGWRVEVTDGDRSWFYRTDTTGNTIRMESRSEAGLPRTVRDRVLQAASDRSGIPVENLKVIEAESQVWNGCLGIDPGPNGACTEIAIDGWSIVVEADSEQFTYHTNQDGSDIRLAGAITF